MSESVIPKLVRWIPPKLGVYKINTYDVLDGAGMVPWWRSGNCDSRFEGLRYGCIVFTQEIRPVPVEIESDAAMVVGWINDSRKIDSKWRGLSLKKFDWLYG
ncbi:hypothetical protein Q3G72_008084 [Acer saccharum]|nr:hypothetical protein Q3G72_008084 [Acer saccharum]